MNTTLNFSKKLLSVISFAIFMGMGLSFLKAQNTAAGEKDIENTAVWSAFQHTKKIRAGLLEVGYAEIGPENGKPVILLHGWPYDIHSFEQSSAILAEKGYRVLVPYLRG